MKTSIVFASIILSIVPVSLWADWGACNISAAGNTGVQLQAGHKSRSDDTIAFTLSATGAQLDNKTDSIGFASGQAKLKGDCEIVAQVVEISDGGPDWAAGGIMLRENFGAGSKFFAAGCSRGHGIRNFIRKKEGEVIAQQENCSDCTPPCWLKIIRHGDHFTSYKSMDGKVWLEINEADVPMKKALWAGAFATSGGGQPAVGIIFAHVAAHESGSK
jgi:hypothetical protein